MYLSSSHSYIKQTEIFMDIKIPFSSLMPAKLNRIRKLLSDSFPRNWLLCGLSEALSTWSVPCNYQPLLWSDIVTIWYHSDMTKCWKIQHLCLALHYVAETLPSEMQPLFNRAYRFFVTTTAAFPFDPSAFTLILYYRLANFRASF